MPDDFFQIAQLARGAAHAEGLVIAIDGDAGRIVTAVFEPFQSLENDGDGLAGPNVADDSAHSSQYSGGRLITLNAL